MSLSVTLASTQSNIEALYDPDQWRTQEKLQGFKVMAGLVGGPGADHPGRQRIFENLQKYFSRKLQKCIILAYFSNKI